MTIKHQVKALVYLQGKYCELDNTIVATFGDYIIRWDFKFKPKNGSDEFDVCTLGGQLKFNKTMFFSLMDTNDILIVRFTTQKDFFYDYFKIHKCVVHYKKKLIPLKLKLYSFLESCLITKEGNIVSEDNQKIADSMRNEIQRIKNIVGD